MRLRLLFFILYAINAQETCIYDLIQISELTKGVPILHLLIFQPIKGGIYTTIFIIYKSFVEFGLPPVYEEEVEYEKDYNYRPDLNITSLEPTTTIEPTGLDYERLL